MWAEPTKKKKEKNAAQNVDAGISAIQTVTQWVLNSSIRKVSRHEIRDL